MMLGLTSLLGFNKMAYKNLWVSLDIPILHILFHYVVYVKLSRASLYGKSTSLTICPKKLNIIQIGTVKEP
jgi:hypothetical protein